MEKLELSSLLSIFIGAMLAGLAAWIWKRFNRIEDNSYKAITAIDADRAREIAKQEQENLIKEVAEVKADLKALATTLLSAVEKQEARQDQLVLHLLGKRNDP